MASNSERFLAAYGNIEHCLRIQTGLERRTRFYKMVDTAAERNPAVRRFSDDLKEFADLRNAIVHERTDEHVIAEPNDRAVRQIEAILTLLENPPRVIPRFQKKVYTMTAEDPIAVAAFVMLEHDFSQLPICDENGFVALLTANDIARWLGMCVPQQVIDLEKATIAEVMNCNCADAVPGGGGDDYTFFDRNATIFAALDAFQICEQCGVRLEAILITENGRPDEALLGIITIWDLPHIYEMLENSNG